jgi:hypothetical protein
MRLISLVSIIIFSAAFPFACSSKDDDKKDAALKTETGATIDKGTAAKADGGGTSTGDKTGACLSTVDGLNSICVVWMVSTDQYLDNAKKACVNSGDTWISEGKCPLDNALGVCHMPSAMAKEQYCYKHKQLDDAEKLDNCKELCAGGTFETF